MTYDEIIHALASNTIIIPIALIGGTVLFLYLLRNKLSPTFAFLIPVAIMLSYASAEYVTIYDQHRIHSENTTAYIQDVLFENETIDLELIEREDNDFMYYRMIDNQGETYTIKIEKESTLDAYDYQIRKIGVS